MNEREVRFAELGEDNVVTIAPYREVRRREWEAFVHDSNNGTIFHTRQFLSYHPANRFRDNSLTFDKKGRLISVLPAALVEHQGQRLLVSHAGSSMAGPVFKLGTSIKDTFFVVERLIEFAKEKKINIIQLTLPPLIYHARPGNYFDFALLENGFTYVKREVSSVIPLDFPEKKILSVFSAESRRAARKAKNLGVQICESNDFAGFYQILKKNLAMRHNVQPTHTLEELISLKKLFPKDVLLLSAEVGGEMIAGVVLFICNPRVGLAFYISHREDKQEFRGVNLLFESVIRLCIQKQLRYLDFGIFTVNMKPNWGLARFKESFGALGVFRDTLIKKV